MKRINLRRIFALFLALALVLPQGVSAGNAETAVFTASGARNMQARSALDLRQAWEAIRVPAYRFDETPSTVYPYRTGKLGRDFLQQNVDMLNFFRLAAGLPAVSDSEADNADAQYGAVVLAAANTLAHQPPRASKMSDDFYQRGCAAASAGNIAVVKLGGIDEADVERNKLRSAVPMIMLNYMNGFGSSHRATVPHRRWILYPDLQSVGIGCADAADSSMYQVLKVMGTQSAGAERVDYDFIAWPASGNFPVQAISTEAPWSISLNPWVFRTPERDSLSITVTRKSDGKTWTFDASSSADSSGDSFLIVDTQRYGVTNCILFAFPEDAYAGDYRVTVTGLITRDGQEAVLDYQMHFVDVVNCTHDFTPWITEVEPTCTEQGRQYRFCRDCGEREEEVLPTLKHVWEITTLLEASSKYKNGSAEFTCALCGAEKTDTLPLTVCKDADCPSARFTDAPAQWNWAHNGIDFVVENGIFNGTSATTFSPTGKMTRAMMVTVLWRMAGSPEAEKDYTFQDVAPNVYYAPAVRWGSETGVVKGFSAERFGPNENVTREQAVTLLQRFLAPDGAVEGDLSGFRDADSVQVYARASMFWAIKHGVINGQAKAGAQYLMPADPITREQAASVIMRCMMNLN